MDFLLNDPANVEWLYNNVPNFSDWATGEWWACMQDNPNQTLWWQNTDVPRFYYQRPDVDGVFFGDYERALQEQDYWWADSWLVMNKPWQLSNNSSSTFTVQPEIPQFVGNLVEDDRVIFWAGAAPRTNTAQCFVLHLTRTEILVIRGLGLVNSCDSRITVLTMRTLGVHRV